MRLALTCALVFLAAACGSPSAQQGDPSASSGGTGVTGGAGGASATGGSTSNGGSVAATGGSAGSQSAGGGTATGGTGASGGSGATGPFGGVESMKLISRDVPAFDSTNQEPNPYVGPNLANDNSGTTGWSISTLPGWLAYDLSGAAEADRQKIHVCWFANNMVYLSEEPGAWQKMPLDYVLESNTAPGGGAPPEGGWTELKTVSDNLYGATELEFDFAGANWLRFRTTKSSDPAGAIQIDMDVYSAPQGGADSWLIMGDSITYMSFMRGFSNVPQMVADEDAARWPFVVDAAIGGTGAITAVDAIEATMLGYPGQFVVLAYGTNDHPDGFDTNMETLVKYVIDAGAVPVVPRMIWSDTKLSEGPEQNAMIDALYEKYPEILKGPDLWSIFEGHTEWIGPGDVHPNEAGQEVLRQEWVKIMLEVQ